MGADIDLTRDDGSPTWLAETTKSARAVLLMMAQKKGFTGTEADFIERRDDDVIAIEVTFEEAA